jgi:hypothetical protein
MGHCAECDSLKKNFFTVATAAKVICTMGDCAGFGSALWAIAQEFVIAVCLSLVICYGPLRECGYALWAMAQDVVLRYGL